MTHPQSESPVNRAARGLWIAETRRKERRSLEHELSSVRWWERHRRSDLNERLAKLRADGTNDEWLPPTDLLRELAMDALRTLRSDSYRNIFHPEISPRLDRLANATAALIKHDVHNELRQRNSQRQQLLPASFTRAIEVDLIKELFEQRVQQLQDIALDPTVLIEHADGDGHTYVAQHVASGKRIRCVLDDQTSFGSIMSKSYSIPSIAPNDRGETSGTSELAYDGLGIGANLYRIAGTEQPNRRWRNNTSNTAASSLRRTLHLEDPYRWGPNACDWCRQHIGEWTNAEETDLDQHPRTIPPPTTFTTTRTDVSHPAHDEAEAR